MNGLLQRIRRRRPEDPAAHSEPPAAPAGSEPEALTAPATPSFRHRGRLRRRLRYLRRVRELGYRDVGGLVFDLRRFGRDEPGLVNAKLDALTAVDAELRGLEDALADHQDVVELREPGVGACTRCAALHASDAHFCSACGLNVSGATGAVVAPGTPIAPDAGAVTAAQAPGQPEPAVDAAPSTPDGAPALEPAPPAGHGAPAMDPDEQPTTVSGRVAPAGEAP